MNIVLTFLGQRPDLSIWEKRDFSPGVQAGAQVSDNRDHHSLLAGIESPGSPDANGPFRRVATSISKYQIFPPRLVEPVLRKTPISLGDTVGLSYRWFPGVQLFMACRVIDVFDGPNNDTWRAGFTYRTLEGHVALGEETFLVEKELTSGKVRVSLKSWSRPSHWLMRIGYPYGRWCQLQAGRAAVAHLQKIAIENV